MVLVSPRIGYFVWKKWIVAAEPAFGWNGDCLSAYNNNRSSANEVAIESNPIGRPILDLIVDVKNFEGTATELLDVLNFLVDESTRKRNEKSKEWPKSGRGVSGKLRRLAPNLRQAGIDVVTDLPNRGIRISMQSTVATDPTAGKVCGSDGQEHTFSDEVVNSQLGPTDGGLRKRVTL